MLTVYEFACCSKQLRKKHVTSGEQANGDDVSDDSDTATIGASDADAESGTETEDYEQGKRMSRHSGSLRSTYHRTR